MEIKEKGKTRHRGEGEEQNSIDFIPFYIFVFLFVPSH